jgi:hypothetical protein
VSNRNPNIWFDKVRDLKEKMELKVDSNDLEKEMVLPFLIRKIRND